MFLAKDLNDGWIILIVVLGFACIGGLSFLIYYLLKKEDLKRKNQMKNKLLKKH